MMRITFLRAATIAALTATALAGCTPVSPTPPSESRYTLGEAMAAAPVDRCRVLQARMVGLDAQPLGQDYAQSYASREETAGAAIGAVLGGLAGSQVGGGDGKRLATGLGAALGSELGRRRGAARAARRGATRGVEYSIKMASGQERLIVQPVNATDRMARPGSTCRVVATSEGDRVLPAAGLPARIARPVETRFAN